MNMKAISLKKVGFGLLISCLLLFVGVAVSTTGRDTTPAPVAAGAEMSHRLIVQLERPSLAQWLAGNTSPTTRSATKINSSAAQAYVSAIESDQSAFVNALTDVLPTASTTGYLNEAGKLVDASYQIVANAVAIDPGTTSLAEARRTIAMMPGVRAVYNDYAHHMTTYTSTQLIDAPALWDNYFTGAADAGRGIKVASVDGGLHHAAAMFDGTNFNYPADYPSGGLGDQSNNNGKIIASRAYFRPWDPPSAGDENAWPGENGTSHGVHTGSTAAGNQTMADYLGVSVPVSGVAPGAWLMSYRVFYATVNDIPSFYSIEGIAALEDAVADGADVINNSWGGGPSGAGGQFDLLDTALINAEEMEVFVSMSAGNAGPGKGTSDHPSDAYVNVAATTSGGSYAAGELNVTSVTTPTLQDLAFSTGDFGPPLELGIVTTYPLITAASVDPANVEGCAAWTGTPFTGHAVLISRGSCNFSDKAYYAGLAGAEFVIIHNNNGDDLVNMTCGSFCDEGEITISSIFIGQTNGVDLTAAYAADGSATIELSTVAQQIGNVADTVADFSSRGPAVGGVLKPDIAAPGVNILAQGYANASGEDRHLGFGEASGTSMAAPHVAGAAALIRAIHPTWTNDMIMAAMMSTAKYIDVYNADGSPAQPLDIGAGRLNLTHVVDVELLLDPPSLSFSDMMTGTSKTIAVEVTNISDAAVSYDVSTEFTGGGFMTITAVAGMSVSPATLSLAPGESATLNVSFDSAMGMMGDNQGYVVLDSGSMKQSMPAWARVNPPMAGNDILLIDNDFSDLLGYDDYTAYYADALDELGYTYDYYSADAGFGNPITLPSAGELAAYKAIILWTGDHYEQDGDFSVATPLTDLDMDILTEYANYGGIVIVMGQDAAASMGGDDGSDNNTFFFDYILGGDEDILQDSVSNFEAPAHPIVSYADGLPALAGVTLDLSAPTVDTTLLSPSNEVPPAASTTTGSAQVTYDAVNMMLSYEINVTPGMSAPITVTAAHIHTGTLGTNGGVLYNIFPFTQTVYVTDTFSFEGSTQITTSHEAPLLAGELYFNVHTEQNPGGELRGQIVATASGDGAGNQLYIDELDSHYGKPADALIEAGDLGDLSRTHRPILRYPDLSNIDEGTVAMAHRAQPSLEIPGITYYGRSIFASFGLEGVNDGTGNVSRAGLLGAFLEWGMGEPTAVFTETQLTDTMIQFEADIVGGDGWYYRWDFGDGSPFYGPVSASIVAHEYTECPTDPVRVEATDSWGNVTIESRMITCDVTPPAEPMYHYWLPIMMTP